MHPPFLRYLLIFLFLFLFWLKPAGLQAQAPKISVYNPQADAAAEIAAAIKKANEQGKHVLLQIGGNWCSWCLKFHELTTTHASLDFAIKANFVVVKVNYSKENQNLPVLQSLDYPQRFGFPVFVVLDAKGNRLHTQNSAYLEEDKGYSPKKIMEFLGHWSTTALDPKRYLKK